jgi:hypothetical protein
MNRYGVTVEYPSGIGFTLAILFLLAEIGFADPAGSVGRVCRRFYTRFVYGLLSGDESEPSATVQSFNPTRGI